jgi:cell cycle sensor histidine kinase DivJ
LDVQTGSRSDWLAGVGRGLDRLVHPEVTGERRIAQRRLLGVLLAAPFVVSAAVAQVAWPFAGIAGVLSMLCGLFGISWLMALAVAARGSERQVRWLALGGGSLLAGMLGVMSGGLAAPLAALLVALPLETIWITRSRKAGMLAAALAAATAIAVVLFPAMADAPAISAWMWISPSLYAMTLALRANEGLSSAQPEDRAGEVLPETGLDAVVVRLSRTGEAESVSPQAARLLGLEPALLLGGGLFERIHVGDRVAFMCAAAQARDEGRPSACEARIRMPAVEGHDGGHYRPFEIEMVPLAPGAVAALVRDGREKAALRDKVARAIEEVDTVEVAKGRFLATVSHELRTPLNAIIGFSDMLLHPEISGDLSVKQAEHVGLIRDAGNHLLSVVNAILDVSKIEAGSYPIIIEPFELRDAVELCCAMLEPQAQARGVRLVASLPHGIGKVLGDRRAVQQILINLVSNAVKFTPEGGQVGVNASSRDGMVRLYVNDTGIGIAGDDLARLGRPFVQVQNDYTRQFQGTGLGLSLVKGLVKLHGGTMSIESAPGLGTTVTVGLPAADHEPDRATQHEAGNKEEERYGTALRKIA